MPNLSFYKASIIILPKPDSEHTSKVLDRILANQIQQYVKNYIPWSSAIYYIVLEKLDRYMQNSETRPSSYSIYKNKLKMD